jgi:hypothetical protein
MNPRPSDEELSGMTTNERLFACGLFDRWNAAAKARDRDQMIALLCQIAFTPKGAQEVADKVLGNPSYYGF